MSAGFFVVAARDENKIREGIGILDKVIVVCGCGKKEANVINLW